MMTNQNNKLIIVSIFHIEICSEYYIIIYYFIIIYTPRFARYFDTPPARYARIIILFYIKFYMIILTRNLSSRLYLVYHISC